jgi:hypothetical protein
MADEINGNGSGGISGDDISDSVIFNVIPAGINYDNMSSQSADRMIELIKQSAVSDPNHPYNNSIVASPKEHRLWVEHVQRLYAVKSKEVVDNDPQKRGPLADNSPEFQQAQAEQTAKVAKQNEVRRVQANGILDELEKAGYDISDVNLDAQNGVPEYQFDVLSMQLQASKEDWDGVIRTLGRYVLPEGVEVARSIAYSNISKDDKIELLNGRIRKILEAERTGK